MRQTPCISPLASQGRHEAGFSLIELMVVIVIIGILSSIAYPSYQQYVLRANRSEGQGLLHDVAMREERFFVQQQRYVTSDAELKLLGVQNQLSATGKYRLTVVPGDTEADHGYRLSATPQGAQAADSCGTLSLNGLGVRGADSDVNTCWR
ncbi:MAG: Fimbrial protein [Pseudomonas citronellolis]|nr:MAG: Fimbrial protein [Pseudomonas citronellolis]